MMNPQTHIKIKSEHLGRKAVVYLRQSSMRQVLANTESQRLQYALVERAKELGFKRVDVIDVDLGASASIGAKQREGFQRLIASIALGEIGLVLSREVSRLSRTDKDWCHLQEVCQVFGVLLGDAEQIYDLGQLDDQLLLGIKGTMSVVELNVLKLRLMEGMQEKARRGELFRVLPPGYVLDGDGAPVMDPDLRVREAIKSIFKKFREIGSIRQAHLWFHAHGIELPVNQFRNGHARIIWKLPAYSFVRYVLQNAFYAGAYVWGQRPTEVRLVEGRLVRKEGTARSPEESKVFIPNHHEGYVEWSEYQENQKRMRGNSLKFEPDAAVAAVRSGQNLLTRLLRCGQCGRKLHVRYWGKAGTAARYVCIGDYDNGGSYCLAFGGSTVDRRFAEELLKAISPLGMRASLRAAEMRSREESGEKRALELQLQEAEYAARRAFEQYDEADPRNRLVASELERRWNSKLEKVNSLTALLTSESQRLRQLTDGERELILSLGEDFSVVWESERCPAELKKRIVRTVIEEVVVNEDEKVAGRSELCFKIHWKGGVHTEFRMPKPPSGVGRKTSLEDLEIIRSMATRYGDEDIARVLTKNGRRTATGKRWNIERVKAIRSQNGIKGRRRRIPDPEILTLAQAAAHGGVSDTTIRRLVEAKILERNQVAPWAPWEIRRTDLEEEPVCRILKRVCETGKLDLEGDRSTNQRTLFP